MLRVVFKIKVQKLPYKISYLFVDQGRYLASQWLLFN